MKKILSVLSLIAVLVGGLFIGYKNISSSVKPTPAPIVVYKLSSDKLLENIQEWRVSNNLPKYVVNNRLCDIAKIRLFDIKNNFSHDGFPETVRRYMGNIDYDFGENLADVNLSETDLLNKWLNSPTHKENLTKNYRYTCIEIDGRLVVQIFANY